MVTLPAGSCNLSLHDQLTSFMNAPWGWFGRGDSRGPACRRLLAREFAVWSARSMHLADAFRKLFVCVVEVPARACTAEPHAGRVLLPRSSPEKKRTDRSVGLMVAVLPAVATNSWKKNPATKWGGDRMVAAQCSTIRGVRNLTEFGVWFRLQRQRRPK